MKKIVYLALAVAACGTGSAMMTLNSFSDISVGATQEEIVSHAGQPYAIHKKKDGSVEYEYIERLNASGRTLEQRHYYILLKDGKVVSKRMKQTSPPPYTFDSYEMQTTHNRGEFEE